MKIKTATIVRLRDALLQSGRRPSLVVSPAYETLAKEGLLSPEEKSAVERIDLLGETMYLMMAADGRIDAAEKDAIRGAIRGLTGRLLHTGTIDAMLENYATRVSEQGRDSRLREIAKDLSKSPVEAECAFSLASAIAIADDDVAAEENALLNQLAESFGVPRQRAAAILGELDGDRAD